MSRSRNLGSTRGYVVQGSEDAHRFGLQRTTLLSVWKSQLMFSGWIQVARVDLYVEGGWPLKQIIGLTLPGSHNDFMDVAGFFQNLAGGGFKHFLFSPLPGEDFPFDYFSEGWFNHQPASIFGYIWHQNFAGVYPAFVLKKCFTSSILVGRFKELECSQPDHSIFDHTPKPTLKSQAKLGGGFKHFLCSPRSLGFHDPIWRFAYFSDGLKQKPTQPPT